MEKLTYDVKDVMEMLNCSQPTAYKKIVGMKQEYARARKITTKNFVAGKIHKDIFHQYYPESKSR